MGASGAQLGTRFAAATESIAHPNFKQAFIRANARDALPSVQLDERFPVIPVRGLVNEGVKRFLRFQAETRDRFQAGELTKEAAQLAIEHFWAGALRRAVIDGDVENGSVMAGQSVGMVTAEQPTAEIIAELVGQAVAALAPEAPRAGMLTADAPRPNPPPHRGEGRGPSTPLSRCAGEGRGGGRPCPQADRMASPRRLLARLRELLAHGTAPLPDLVRLVAAELVSEVCSVYAARPGEILELVATEGLNPQAIGRTRLRVGEGIVGLCAATAQVMNLPDAQNHPAFAYRPETGEEPFASMLAVPVRRAGRTLGVLAVQNRNPRALYRRTKWTNWKPWRCCWPRCWRQAARPTAPRRASARPCRGCSPARTLVPGIAIGPVVLHGSRRRPLRLLADDPDAELARLHEAAQRMQHGLDELIAGVPDGLAAGADASASREVLEAYRLVAADAGWLKRVAEVIRGGLSAEAAVQRVAGELHDRMRRITDPYLRERLADLEDLAGRLLAALAGDEPRPAVPHGRDPAGPPAGPGRTAGLARRRHRRRGDRGSQSRGHAAILARALGLPAVGGARGHAGRGGAGRRGGGRRRRGPAGPAPRGRGARHLRPGAGGEERAQQAGWAALRDRPAATADGVRVVPDAECRPAAWSWRSSTPPAPTASACIRTEIAMLARGADRRRGRAGGDLRPRAGCRRRAAGAVPHARPRRRQAAAGRRAGGGKSGDGLALAAHRPGSAGAAAPPVARAAAGGRRARRCR